LHRDLPQLPFPNYPTDDVAWKNPVHATAKVDDGAELRGCSVTGARTHLGAGAILEDTIVWPGAEIRSRSHLRNCIVRANQKAEGELRDIDI
jgi:NDP-sugar pyrophosphorylase family protein